MQRLNRLLVVAAVAVAALVIATVGIAMAKSSRAPSKVTVATTGSNNFFPDKKNPPNQQPVGFEFTKGTIKVRSGGTVTWVSKDKSGDPHTITIAKKNQLPKSFTDCKKPCQVAQGHLVDPNDPTKGIKQPVLNAGKPGLDTVGDSLVLPPNGKVSAKISAKAGTRLYYVCAIHPWMQGLIIVEK